MAIKFGVAGVMSSNRSGLIQVAREAEQSGVDSFQWADHLQAFPYCIWKPELVGPLATFAPDPNQQWDVVATLATVGAVTERLRVAACVTEAMRRHPATLAQEWLTLHHLTEGRAILGIGAGEKENTIPYGIPLDRPMGRMEEALRIIRLLWESQGPVSFDGEFWKLDNAVIGLGPYNGTFPPIWTATLGPRGMRVTAELADGWVPWSLSVDEFAERRASIIRSANEIGRNIDHFTWGLVHPTMVGEDHEAIHKALFSNYLCRWTVVATVGQEFFSRYGLTHPFGEDYRGIMDYLPNAYSTEEYMKAFEAVPEEMMHDFFLHGTPDEIVSVIRQYESVGANYHVHCDVSGFGDPTMAAKAAPLVDMIIAECSR